MKNLYIQDTIAEKQQLLTKSHRINKLIEFDGLALKKRGKIYKVVATEEKLVFGSTITSIDHEFIQDQIAKCQDKIQNNDFSGAITNARSLLEAVIIYAIENIERVEIKNDGNLENLWTRCKKALKISFERTEIPDFVFQTLSGLDTVVKGLSGISNNAGDRHANKFNAKKHHAKLAVNSSMTLSEYIIDLMDLRKIAAPNRGSGVGQPSFLIGSAIASLNRNRACGPERIAVIR